MALIDDFKTRFPEFDTDIVDTYLPLLENVWQYYWQGSYTGSGVEIVLNLLGHLMIQEAASAASTDGSPAKDIASKAVGSVSISYATAQSKSVRDEWLKSTVYGMRYLWLVMHNHGGVFV